MLFAQFPERVNENAARTTAMLVVVLTAATVISALFLLRPLTLALNVVLAAGFLLRVWAGPKYSIFGQLSVRRLADAVFGGPRIVSGAPKQFAQGIGFVFSLTALVFTVLGSTSGTVVTLALLIVAASAEAFLGFCAGCWIYRHAQRAGVFPPDACETCAI